MSHSQVKCSFEENGSSNVLNPRSGDDDDDDNGGDDDAIIFFIKLYRMKNYNDSNFSDKLCQLKVTES